MLGRIRAVWRMSVSHARLAHLAVIRRTDDLIHSTKLRYTSLISASADKPRKEIALLLAEDVATAVELGHTDILGRARALGRLVDNVLERDKTDGTVVIYFTKIIRTRK